MRDKRQHCDAISPLNDTHATLSRQFGDIVAWVSHWGYGGGQVPGEAGVKLLPSFHHACHSQE